MAKPVISKILPFDATKDYTLKMSYLGNLPKKNRIIIYNADSMKEIPIENPIIDSGLFERTIPADTLQNGKNYAIQCSFIDSDGNESPLSDKQFFMTLETPIFKFSNAVDDVINIDTSYLGLTVIYQQAQNESIRSYTMNLYNSAKELIETSGMKYDIDETSAYAISYSFKGIDSATVHYVECVGVTMNGMPLSTGMCKVIAEYEDPGIYSRIYAEANPINSAINYHTNFVIIKPERDDYEFNNGYILLEHDNIVYKEGFIIPENATFVIKGKSLYKESTIFKCSDDNYYFELSSKIYETGELIYELRSKGILSDYVIYSDKLIFSDNDEVTIFIRKIGNVYQLKCFINYGVEDNTNMFFGLKKPALEDSDIYDVWIDLDEEPTIKIDKSNVHIYETEIPTTENKFDIWLESEED